MRVRYATSTLKSILTWFAAVLESDAPDNPASQAGVDWHARPNQRARKREFQLRHENASSDERFDRLPRQKYAKVYDQSATAN